MYSVLKSKRCHFEIPLNSSQNQDEQNYKDSSDFLYGSQKIVSSCFLDDRFILFLFNSGRYIIVNSNGQNKGQIETKKKSKTIESQIVYDGNILKETQGQIQTEGIESKATNYSSQKLLSKSSMKMIEESYTKTIFTDCKRIKTNECIIITRYSKNIYCLKVSKQSIEGIKQNELSIKTSIIQLPGTALSQILSVDKLQMNMTILTDLIEFDNSAQSHCKHSKEQMVFNEKGSFCIKNEIVEDKMIYFTCYTRIPQHVRQKCKQMIIETKRQFLPQNTLLNEFPHFIITKFQFPIPVNEVSSNFIIEISDKFSNQITIYKQSQDDQNQWGINLYRIGYENIQGEQIVRCFTQQMIKNYQNAFYFQQNVKAIENRSGHIKPIVVTLPQQFTTSIHLQQFLRIDQHYENSKNQAQYMILSVNQTHVETQQNLNQNVNEFQTVRVNGQLFHLDANGIIRQPQNATNNKNCWIHSCKLTFHQNSQTYTQHIQRLHSFKIDSLSFLKVIDANYRLGLMYVLSLAHQTVDGQLYENKIDLINLKNGQVVEKGYCSLKNYSFSPNQRYILDTADTFSQESDYFYHIRILFDKKSLYLFMFENANEYLQQYKDVNFIETVLSLL